MVMRSAKLSVLAASAALATGAAGCGVGETLGLEHEPSLDPNSPACSKIYEYSTDKFGAKVQKTATLAIRESNPDTEIISDVISDNAGCFEVETPHVDSIFGFRSRLKDRADLGKNTVDLAINNPLQFAQSVQLTDRVKEGKVNPIQGSDNLDNIASSTDADANDLFTFFKDRIHGVAFQQTQNYARKGLFEKAYIILDAFPDGDEESGLPTEIYSDYSDAKLIPLAFDSWDKTVFQRAKQLVADEEYDNAFSLGQEVYNDGQITEDDFIVYVNRLMLWHEAVQQAKLGYIDSAYGVIERLPSSSKITGKAINRLQQIEEESGAK